MRATTGMTFEYDMYIQAYLMQTLEAGTVNAVLNQLKADNQVVSNERIREVFLQRSAEYLLGER